MGVYTVRLGDAIRPPNPDEWWRQLKLLPSDGFPWSILRSALQKDE